MLFALITFSYTLTYGQQIKYDIIDKDNYNISDNIVSTPNGLLQYEESTSKKLMIRPLGIGVGPGNKRGYKITKINNALSPENSVELFDGQKLFIGSSSQIINFQNHNGIIYQEVLEGDELGDIKFLEINAADLSVKKEMVLMDFKKNGITFSSKKVIKGDVSTFKIYQSQNKKRLMIISRSKYKKGEDEYIHINVLNEDLKLVQYRKLIVTPEEICYTTICDDLGNIYGTFKEVLNENGKIKKREIDNNPLKIKAFKIGEKNPITFSIKHEEHSFHFNELMFSSIQNKVYLVGAYSEGKGENFKGVYHASIDVPKMALTKMVQTPFSDELIKKYDKDGYASTKDKNEGLSRYFIPKYIVRGDGTIDFVLFYNQNETITTNSSNGGIRTRYINYGGNILDAHIADNKVTLATISRDMSSQSVPVYNDFSLYSKNENLIVIYNDNENNVSRTADEKPKRGVVQDSEMVAATINKNGTVSKQLLLNGYKGKTIGLLNYIYPLPGNSFLVLMQRLNGIGMSTKDTKYARVTID